jgi:hypothetical protein
MPRIRKIDTLSAGQNSLFSAFALTLQIWKRLLLPQPQDVPPHAESFTSSPPFLLILTSRMNQILICRKYTELLNTFTKIQASSDRNV